VSASSDYQKLRAHLAFLRMTAAAEALPGLLEQAAKDKLTSQTFLERLLAVEVGAVDERRRAAAVPVHPRRLRLLRPAVRRP